MAYYDAFKTKWAQAPAGTTQSKLNWVNAATTTGAAVRMIVPAYEIYNRTDRAEYNLLKPTDQSAVQRNLAPATVDYSPNSALRLLYTSLFPPTGGSPPTQSKTQQNLAPYVAQFDTPTVPWWSTANQPPETPYTRPFDMGDVTAAGVS
jgi:hypothetical protein